MRTLLAVLMVLAFPAVAGAQTYPEPKDPGPVEAAPKGPHKTLTVCKKGCDVQVDPEGGRQGARG